MERMCVRLSLTYQIPPHVVGQRFTVRDVARIAAFWEWEERQAKDAERQARVNAAAKQERRRAAHGH